MSLSTTTDKTYAMADMLCTALLLCKGFTASQTPFWAYLAIKPSDARAFIAAKQAGAMNLEDYGTILEWGEGEEPPEEVKARMRDQFGMREDYEEWLLSQI